ncbi:hypothetical protein E2C00_15090 [Streptomyces sp. WAC05374]|uniref:hypothetical protein n=1 Tax=Streptomyces sp. WAC05374 TaxID=2487420 RepID=UPI000F8757C4|nr:hypothetical protein [Streptomyces sp. WAC05374]RST10193.1 hypothetical protein EF905_27885 [Streptomyces sp. WAC05374]TDF48394.1 hypothetical protein E2B92_05815 [Streptomyces sp. WAC05374]TDF55050.1 hypothetical protein E2C02_16570 [Streptomyces sp. WAC05374]TDF55328.1 hypothetical protein E2C00_15090 [Streptomyces sp. WAC05374]
METALIAVIGTLLGAVVTHFFQGRAAQRTAALTRAEQLRQERISTYSAFADAVVEYRQAQNARWYRRNGSHAEETRLESYDRRAAARQALVRVQLVCDDPATVELARRTFEVTHCMHEARDEGERERRSDEAVAALAAFIEAAAPGVR